MRGAQTLFRSFPVPLSPISRIGAVENRDASTTCCTADIHAWLVPISEPYVAQETLLAWVTEAVTQAYTLDYVHYRKQLTAMRPNFSDEGFKHHLQALEAAGTLEAIIKRRLVSQVVPTAPPVVVNQGVLADRYAWKIEMKLGLSYQGASSQSTPQALVAEVLVVRMPTHEVPRGLAVHQLITRGS